MLKPYGYDECNVGFGERIILPPGAYVCRIRQVQEVESKRGTPQIKVELDIAEGDFYNFWRAKWEEKLAEKKNAGYPRGGTAYISVNKFQSDEINPQFKAFCEAFRKSNECDINWTTSEWGRQFEGRFIGAVYRHEEQEFRGYKYMQPSIAYWCSVDSARSGEIKPPATKYLSADSGSSFSSDVDFPDTFSAAESDIPF